MNGIVCVCCQCYCDAPLELNFVALGLCVLFIGICFGLMGYCLSKASDADELRKNNL